MAFQFSHLALWWNKPPQNFNDLKQSFDSVLPWIGHLNWVQLGESSAGPARFPHTFVVSTPVDLGLLVQGTLSWDSFFPFLVVQSCSHNGRREIRASRAGADVRRSQLGTHTVSLSQTLLVKATTRQPRFKGGRLDSAS